MFKLPRNVWILALSSSLFMSLSVFIIFIGGIIGQSISPIKSLSTLPVAMIVIGTAFSIFPINYIMSKIGRRYTFLSVCVFTIINAILAVTSLYLQSFNLFCFSTFLFGATVATMQQFRFAAIESVNKEQITSATSLVLLAGLISAYLGPEIATNGKNLFEVQFVGSFVLLAICFVVAFVLLSLFKPAKKLALPKDNSKRKLIEIIKQPTFIVAMSSAASGYVIMSYVMTATPISMHSMDGFSLEQTKFVIQSHVIAMFLPSLFTPMIVKLLGLNRMLIIGILLYFVCVAIALLDHLLINYWVSLVLLGLGWNFLYIGGTALLPSSYEENEKFKVQTVNDFSIFGFQAFASLSAGWFVFNYGWESVLYSVVPIILIQFFILLWWLKHKKT